MLAHFTQAILTPIDLILTHLMFHAGPFHSGHSHPNWSYPDPSHASCWPISLRPFSPQSILSWPISCWPTEQPQNSLCFILSRAACGHAIRMGWIFDSHSKFRIFECFLAILFDNLQLYKWISLEYFPSCSPLQDHSQAILKDYNRQTTAHICYMYTHTILQNKITVIT